jgi:hypothetical protein
MNTYRKIQLSAAAVIANGALALGLLSPSPARATTCGQLTLCSTFSGEAQCLVEKASFCEAYTPAGCTYTSSYCTPTLCILNHLEVVCTYTAS